MDLSKICAQVVTLLVAVAEAVGAFVGTLKPDDPLKPAFENLYQRLKETADAAQALSQVYFP